MRRALAINEESLGPNHFRVAIDLNNLGAFLKDTNRLIEAESLIRRALIIFIKSLGLEHPNSHTAMSHYIHLLGKLGMTENEIQAYILAFLK